jgi:hypothetical protein
VIQDKDMMVALVTMLLGEEAEVVALVALVQML